MSLPYHVAINGLSAHTGGGLTYLTEQIKALADLQDEPFELTVFATGSLASACRGLSRVRVRRIPHLPLPIRVLFEQLVLPLLVRKADVVYCPGNFALLLSRVPQVITFQNPNHFGSEARRVRREHYPLRLRGRKRLEAWAARNSLRRSKISLAISESLRSTILEDVPQPRDLRLLLSAQPNLPGSKGGAPAGSSYDLTVANDYPHKDWDGLIELFTSRDDLRTLVIVGQPRSWRRLRQLRRRIASSRHPHGVVLQGLVHDRNVLAELYAGAVVYLAHSRLEAFPLTPYEAMAFGRGVAASDIPPHREVCGDAAAYYPVDDLDALARLLKSGSVLAGDPPEIGRTWRDNALELSQVLRAAAR